MPTTFTKKLRCVIVNQILELKNWPSFMLNGDASDLIEVYLPATDDARN